MTARAHRPVTAIAVASLVAILAACGSSSGAGVASDAISDTALTSARDAVENLKDRPSDLAVEPLAAAPEPGKTIDFVQCGLPTCELFGSFVKKAVEAAGWKFRALNAGLTPQTVAAAYDQAVRDEPAGVIGTGGFSTELFGRQLDQLQELGIPVVLQAVETEHPAVTSVLLDKDYYAAIGENVANLVIADSAGAEVHLGIVTTPSIAIYENAHGPMSDTIEAACEECSTKELEFLIPDVGSKLPAQVVTFLRANPDINYLYFDFSNALNGVPAALQGAGITDVKLVTSNTGPTESGYIAAGQQLGTAALPWPEALWWGVDTILRVDAGQEPLADFELPQMLVTKDNLPTTEGLFPLVEDYQSIFKEAWQVS